MVWVAVDGILFYHSRVSMFSENLNFSVNFSFFGFHSSEATLIKNMISILSLVNGKSGLIF